MRIKLNGNPNNSISIQKSKKLNQKVSYQNLDSNSPDDI